MPKNVRCCLQHGQVRHASNDWLHLCIKWLAICGLDLLEQLISKPWMIGVGGLGQQ